MNTPIRVTVDRGICLSSETCASEPKLDNRACPEMEYRDEYPNTSDGGPGNMSVV